jgi:hypothetical protein
MEAHQHQDTPLIAEDTSLLLLLGGSPVYFRHSNSDSGTLHGDVGMKRSFVFLLMVLVLGSCRDYDLRARLSDEDGLVPADQFARYGREQAQEMAIAREYAHSGDTSYARSLPDVIDTHVDSLGYRQTIHFKSGWLTMVTPIDDGKRGAETAGLPTGSPGSAP